MARIVPEDITPEYLAESHKSEIRTLKLLRDRLPESHTVYHGVHWTYAGGSRDLVFGEIDFILVNGAGNVLVIEQKSGKLTETEEGLVKLYPGTQKNVVRQIHRAIDNLRGKWSAQHGRGGLELDFLLYCPQYKVRDLSAAGLDSSRIADSSVDLIERILALLPEQTPQARESVQRIHQFFRQHLDLVADVHAHVMEGERSFTRLVGPIVRSVRAIEMEPLRLRVRGTAGCGKTQAVSALTEAALAQGRRPLVVCFNRPLRERLHALLPKRVRVLTYYGLLGEFLKYSGVPLNHENEKAPNFWEEATERAIEQPVTADWTHDCLIVDEGQDFHERWLDVLRLFLTEGADLIWLEDQRQNINGVAPVELPGHVGYRIDVNYRSPITIARFIRRQLGVRFEEGSPLPGLGVGVHAVDTREEQPRAAGRVVQDLVRQGFRHKDIAIVTLRGLNRSALDGQDRVGTATLSRFTGQYDMFGNQVWSSGQVMFDSVRRFKGQQAAAVVLVDADAGLLGSETGRAALFCGMTRATVRLDVVTTGGLWAGEGEEA